MLQLREDPGHGTGCSDRLLLGGGGWHIYDTRATHTLSSFLLYPRGRVETGGPGVESPSLIRHNLPNATLDIPWIALQGDTPFSTNQRRFAHCSCLEGFDCR